ncbi:hypothetical protein LCGC14_2585100, partial [marine sediment metagenome]
MKPEYLAISIYKYFDSLDDNWYDIKDAVLKQLGIVVSNARRLHEMITESEAVFVNVLVEMLLIARGTPKIWKPVFRWLLKRVFNNFIMPILKKKFGDDFLSQVNDRSLYLETANRKLID